MKTRPSPWLLGPALTAFCLFADAHSDVLFMGLCAAAIVVSYLHTLHIEAPNRQHWMSTASLSVVAWTLCVVYYGTVMRGGAARVQAGATMPSLWLISTAGMMLGLAVVWLWYMPSSSDRKTGPLLACIGLLIVSGCHRLSSSFLSLNLLAFCGGAVLLTLFAFGGSLRNTQERSLGAQLYRSLVVISCIALIGAGTMTVSLCLRHLERFFERMIADIAQGRQYTGFLGVGDHLRLQRQQRIRLSRRIVATLDGTRAPGYLRTQVLTQYHHDRWRATASSSTQSFETGDGPNRPTQRWYRLHADEAAKANQTTARQTNRGDQQRVELRMNLRGAVPLPYTTQRVNLPPPLTCLYLPGALFDCTPAVHLTGYTIEHTPRPATVPYGIGQALRPWPNSAQQPGGTIALTNQQALEVPEAVMQALRPLALQIIGPSPLTAMATAQRIQTHFRRHYTYALDVKLAPYGDPTVDFVLNRRPAYCQYFASGMVLLRRTLGIPARVVSGFAVREFNPLTRQWIVRQRDAHAWVEVYDAPSNRWVAFDATPPDAATRLDQHQAWHWLGPVITWLELRLPSAIAAFNKAMSRDWGDWITSIRQRWLLQPMCFVISGCAAGAVAFWLWGWKGLAALYQQWRGKRQPTHAHLEPAMAEAQRHFRQIALVLQDRGMAIEPTETLEEYLHRLTASQMASQAAEAQALAALLNEFTRRYMALRFGLQTADAATIRTQLTALRQTTERIKVALSRRRSPRLQSIA